ncbi:MAG: hypothetical protein IH991_14995 [Planctomycetes bacterium]|nr:hypothetical protein [Planctomycetota bacterium]
MSANSFPNDGDGYEWDSVTWAPNSLQLYSVPWQCEKCDKQHLMLTLSGEVDVDYTSQRTGGRGSRRVKVWTSLREEDTRKLPNAMDAFLRRDGIRIDAIDTENEAQGLATIRRVYRENRQHQRKIEVRFIWNKVLYYSGPENSTWTANTLTITTISESCRSCEHAGPPLQLLTGTVKGGRAQCLEPKHRNYLNVKWVNKRIKVSSFMHPNDNRSMPVPFEILAADDNYNVSHAYDPEKTRTEQLQLLRREWEKANRD